MIGNDLIAAIPWIVFAVLLALVCLRLWCTGRQDDLEPRQPSEDGGDSPAAPASAGAPGTDDYDGHAVSPPAHSASQRAIRPGSRPSDTSARPPARAGAGPGRS